MTLVQKEIVEVYLGNTRVRPAGRKPGANTLLYLPLSEDLKDYGSKNITITNSGVSIATKGNIKCGYFNGSSYLYTNTTDGANFDFGTNQDFTVSWYMNKNSWIGTTTLINKKYNDGSHGWIIYKDSGDDLRFRISSSNLDTKINSSTSTGLRALYTFIRKGTTTYIYKNGVLTNTGNGNGDASYSSKGLYIGGGPYTSRSPTYLNGYLSEVIIENKARTATEILDYYNNTKSNYGL